MQRSKLTAFLADFGVYVFCAVGVAMSRYIPDFKAGIEPEFIFSWFRLLMSTVIAFMVMFTFDAGGDKAGKRQRWARRAAFALSQGFVWEQLIA